MSSTGTVNLQIPGVEPTPKKSLFFNQRRSNHSKSHVHSSKSNINSRRSSFRKGTDSSHNSSKFQSVRIRSSRRASFNPISGNISKRSSGANNTPKSKKIIQAEEFDKRLSDFNLIPSSRKRVVHSVARNSILDEIYSPRFSHFKKKRIELLDKVSFLLKSIVAC